MSKTATQLQIDLTENRCPCGNPAPKATAVGRSKVYCSNRCRANAYRARVWAAYEAELAIWAKEDAEHDRFERQRLATWRSWPVEPEPSWAEEARAAGWTPPDMRNRRRLNPTTGKAEAEPVLTRYARTMAGRPEPACPAVPRPAMTSGPFDPSARDYY